MGISAKMPPSVVAILLCVILFTTSCAVEPKKMIVGTWRDRDGDAWEFFPDGTLSVSTKRGAVTGKYSFPDQDHIKLEMDGIAAGFGPKVGTYSVSSDVLNITLNGQEDVFHRTK
jgi:hypothetical protein